VERILRLEELEESWRPEVVSAIVVERGWGEGSEGKWIRNFWEHAVLLLENVGLRDCPWLLARGSPEEHILRHVLTQRIVLEACHARDFQLLLGMFLSMIFLVDPPSITFDVEFFLFRILLGHSFLWLELLWTYAFEAVLSTSFPEVKRFLIHLDEGLMMHLEMSLQAVWVIELDLAPLAGNGFVTSVWLKMGFESWLFGELIHALLALIVLRSLVVLCVVQLETRVGEAHLAVTILALVYLLTAVDPHMRE
jgi:hypothetical protein